MSEIKEYSNEMRGTLWMLGKDERKDRGPIATGTITVSGVELRIAMWPSAKVAKPGSKADGKVYMSLALEYKQGATKFLAPVSPSAVTVAAATAVPPSPVAAGAAANDATDPVDDMPF